MNAASRLIPFVLGLAAALVGQASAQEQKAPYELVRTLRSIHDQIVQGSSSAHAYQRELLAHIARQLSEADSAAWQEPRNSRAAIVYVLSGGDPRVLRKLVPLAPLPGIDDKLLNGTLAYGEGRNAEALDLLGKINARTLDPSISGHVALVQSILMTRKDRAKAVALLDDARLLAPGTLVEEAALRREILLVAATGNFEKFESLSSQYMRRFPRSVYAGNFRVQFAMHLTRQKEVDDPSQLSKLEDALENIAVADRQDVYLTIAREGISQGKVEIARFAATKAGTLTQEDSRERARSSVYAGAAQVVTDDFDRGLSSLKSVERTMLGHDDAQLLDAALEVAEEVRRMPPPDTPPPPPKKPGVDDRALQLMQSEVIKQAQAAIVQVDQFLSGVPK